MAGCGHRYLTMPNTHQHKRLLLLAPWRRTFQWLTTLTIILLPWIQPDGVSLVRIDIPSLSLHLFGQVLRIQELYLLLIFILATGAAFLFITLVFGRLWCGWACPQTTLTDLAEWFAERLKLKLLANRLQGALPGKILAHSFYLLLASLVSANLLWYFIEPQRFLAGLVSGTLHPGVLISFLVIAAIIYLDLGLIRRLMCREFCPYGRIQSSFVDPATLTLNLPEKEKPRCIRCNSCVRACPMGIDIRNGYQIECINCGRCLDACRQIMAKRDEPGLIYYTFGIDNRGVKGLLNLRVLLLGLLLISLLSALTYATLTRTSASLKVSLAPAAVSRIVDNQQTTLFTVWINNRSTDAQEYQLRVRAPGGEPLEIRGQTEQIPVAAGGNYQLRLMVLSPVSNQPIMVEFQLFSSHQQPVATATAQLSASAHRQ
ncbi:4Fe-4S dicluster domain-containing protein [Pelovirga terrestris]|uniref:4Fe-4S binding protein n=1 Tax=Pelovirga terrestris TaxID=2771352 RepID=A0A8J6QXC8_9BACT|nr:4Fe-4S binding protein [Pelovirga terrestris]